MTASYFQWRKCFGEWPLVIGVRHSVTVGLLIMADDNHWRLCRYASADYCNWSFTVLAPYTRRHVDLFFQYLKKFYNCRTVDSELWFGNNLEGSLDPFKGTLHTIPNIYILGIIKTTKDCLHDASATLDWNPGLAEYGAGVLKAHIVIGITNSVCHHWYFSKRA